MLTSPHDPQETLSFKESSCMFRGFTGSCWFQGLGCNIGRYHKTQFIYKGPFFEHKLTKTPKPYMLNPNP